MSRRLRELRRSRPDDAGAAAEPPPRFAHEVVLDARPEVVHALNPLQKAAVQDEIDSVGGVEPERRDRVVGDLELPRLWNEIVRAAVGVECVRITGGPAEVEPQPQPVFDELLLELGCDAPLAEVSTARPVGRRARGPRRARVRVLHRAEDRRAFGFEPELLVSELEPQIGHPDVRVDARKARAVVRDVTGRGVRYVRSSERCSGLVVREKLLTKGDVASAVEDDLPVRERHLDELRALLAHEQEGPLADVVELCGVGACPPGILGWMRYPSFGKIPGAAQVQIERLDRRDGWTRSIVDCSRRRTRRRVVHQRRPK